MEDLVYKVEPILIFNSGEDSTSNKLVRFPLGYIFGISDEISSFRKKLLLSFDISLPVTINSSFEEFIDCLEESDLYRPNGYLHYKIIDKNKDRNFKIEESESRIYGYLGFTKKDILNILNKINFLKIRGTHFFHLKEKTDSNYLDILQLSVPTLSSRKIDAVFFADIFLKNQNKNLDGDMVKKIYDNDVKYALELIDLLLSNECKHKPYSQARDDFDYDYCLKTYNLFDKNISLAAKEAGISRNTFKEKLRIK